MKNHAVIIALLAGGLAGAPAYGSYTSIDFNPGDSIPGTSYVGGVLNVYSDTSELMTLNDPEPLDGTISNTVFSLTTSFANTFTDGGQIYARFSGGSVSLTFDYDADGPGPDPAESFYINGQIPKIVFSVWEVGPTSTIYGDGDFSATWDLPGSNDWLDQLLSQIKATSIAFDQDLTGFDWETDELLDGRINGRIVLYPFPRMPEPATILLFLTGGVLCRRGRGRLSSTRQRGMEAS